MPAHAQTSTAAIVAAGRQLAGRARHGRADHARRGRRGRGTRAVALQAGARPRRPVPAHPGGRGRRADLGARRGGGLRRSRHGPAGDGGGLPPVRPLEPGHVHADDGPAGRARRDGAVRALLSHAAARCRGGGRPGDALPAARTIVAWTHGFISMELAGAFRLGGDVEQAWEFGLDRILTAVRRLGADRGSPRPAGPS